MNRQKSISWPFYREKVLQRRFGFPTTPARRVLFAFSQRPSQFPESVRTLCGGRRRFISHLQQPAVTNSKAQAEARGVPLHI